MANDKGEAVLEKQSSSPSAPSSNGPLPTGAFLVSPETKEFLERAGDGTLGTPVVSNITDTFVVSSNNSNDQTCNKSQESSESPITTVSVENQMEKGSYKSVNNDSAGNVISIEDSSDKAEDKLHEKVDSSLCFTIDPKHDDGVESTLQSEIHSGEEDCKIESEKSNELGSMNFSTSPGCPSSLAAPVSDVEKNDLICENESDENDEFFDSVTSPLEKTNLIRVLDKVDDSKGITQDVSIEVQIPIANVTTTETSTDELIKIDAESRSQADIDTENEKEILDDIQGQRGCEEKTEDNSKIILTSQSDGKKGADSDSPVLDQTESERNSKEMKSSSNETFDEKTEIAMVSEITGTIVKDMDNDIGLADVAGETHPPLKDQAIFGTKIPLEKSGMSGEDKKIEDLHDTLLEREEEDTDKCADIAADEEDLVIREDEIIEETERDSDNLSMNDDKKMVSPEVGLTVDVKDHRTIESYEVVGVGELETAGECSTAGKEKDVTEEPVQKESLKVQTMKSAKSLEDANMEQKLSDDKEENLELKIDENLNANRKILDPENVAFGEQNDKTSNTEGETSVVEKVDLEQEQLNDKTICSEENLSIPLNKNFEGQNDNPCIKDQHNTDEVKVNDLSIKPQLSVEDSDEGNHRKPPDLMDRTTSFGGESQYSEGGIIDDYDLDDINDILNDQEATAKSDNPAEWEKNSEVQDEIVSTDEVNTDEHMGKIDTTKDGNGSEKCDTEAILEDQTSANAETMKSAESQDPLEVEDLEQALDLKMKEKSKKKSKRFSLFRKVFK